MNLWVDVERLVAALGFVLAYVWMCVRIYRKHGRSLVSHSANRDADGARATTPGAHHEVVVAYASQTGCAEELAQTTAERLASTTQTVSVLPLSAIDARRLKACSVLLVVASTYGEGDAPDNGALFAERIAEIEAGSLAGLQYGLLALGDSSYTEFCGFGRMLDQQFQRCGARALFARHEVDQLNEAALQSWFDAVGHWSKGDTYVSASAHAQFEAWTLAARTCLNPASTAAPIYLLTFKPTDARALPKWEAGDLALILPPGEAPRPREYSIASIPAGNALQLIVRVLQKDDGQPGLTSAWLTQQLEVGQTVPLRLRRNSAFHLDQNAHRPMILIGNGSGLAGLRGHLHARAHADLKPNWLIFGERHPEHDALCREEIQQWKQSGVLARADLVFSRAPSQKIYVQDSLRTNANTLIEWVEQGAAIYVCGSLEGMAGGVDAVLQDILGPDLVHALKEKGRYRRDVY